MKHSCEHGNDACTIYTTHAVENTLWFNVAHSSSHNFCWSWENFPMVFFSIRTSDQRLMFCSPCKSWSRILFLIFFKYFEIKFLNLHFGHKRFNKINLILRKINTLKCEKKHTKSYWCVVPSLYMKLKALTNDSRPHFNSMPVHCACSHSIK